MTANQTACQLLRKAIQIRKLYTGTEGVSPAASAKREPETVRQLLPDYSRLTALAAGETPALPLKS
jgi:hypothetical protein